MTTSDDLIKQKLRKKMQNAKPLVPMRSFVYGGNEHRNPSFYPLPLGKNEFSTRCG